MSSDWYLINSPYYTEGTEVQDFNFDSNYGFNDVLTDTPLGDSITLCKGEYDKSTGLFETEFITKGIIQGNSPETQTKGWERQLLIYPNSIKDYKYVKANGSLWLIMTKPASNKVYEKVVLYLCNYIAKWQNKDNNIVYQPFFITNASQYNSGEEGSKNITIGYNQLLIYTSLDANTVVLNRNNRMFLDYNKANPIPYRITRIDTVSFSYGESRVCSLILTEDQYNPETDNIDLMLCDYQSSVPSPITIGINIKYVGNPQIRSGGSAKTFTAETTSTIIWSLITTSAQKDFIILTQSENTCKVKCLSNDLLIGSSFKLCCTDGTNTTELLIDIVGGM